MRSIIGVLILSAVSISAQARIGGHTGNGGDPCEQRFQDIRDDLVSWIEKGGSKSLKLPATLKHSDYKFRMLAETSSAIVMCTSEKLELLGAEKTCLNMKDEGRPGKIICHSERFLSASESDQYLLVHHEYAGLAEIETNKGPASSYKISKQLHSFLEDRVVKRLVIREADDDTQDPFEKLVGLYQDPLPLQIPSFSLHTGTGYYYVRSESGEVRLRSYNVVQRLTLANVSYGVLGNAIHGEFYSQYGTWEDFRAWAQNQITQGSYRVLPVKDETLFYTSRDGNTKLEFRRIEGGLLGIQRPSSKGRCNMGRHVVPKNGVCLTMYLHRSFQ